MEKIFFNTATLIAEGTTKSAIDFTVMVNNEVVNAHIVGKSDELSNGVQLYEYEVHYEGKLSNINGFMSGNENVVSCLFSDNFYMQMKKPMMEGAFENCTSLKVAPQLPYTKLRKACYRNMFKGCISLTTAPELPAEELKEACYLGMFTGCYSLTTAPKLPATKLEKGCYNSMFSCCWSLTTAPELPAMELAEGCYFSMFANCIKLKVVPSLPSKAAKRYYQWFFDGNVFINYYQSKKQKVVLDMCRKVGKEMGATLIDLDPKNKFNMDKRIIIKGRQWSVNGLAI